MNPGTYQEQNVAGSIVRLLSEHGFDGALDNGDLERIALLDQFHVGGSAAVDRVINPIGLRPGDRVLDVGSGCGGPARWVAVHTGAHVHGIDLADEYVKAAKMVTARVGLDEVATFEKIAVEQHRGAALYDAAITMHVQMNVCDKREWFAAIRRLLRPGGSLGVWEIVGRGDSPPPLVFPLPWSIDGTDSHVVTADRLRADIEAAGFRAREWADEGPWVREWFAGLFAGGAPQGPSVAEVINDGLTRTANLFTAIEAGRLGVRRGWFEAA